jgi:hypothetical protein
MRRLQVLATGCLLLGLTLPTPLWAATVTQRQSATQDTWHNGTATLANNAQVQSGNVTLTNVGDLSAYCTLTVPTLTGAPSANTAVVVWFQVSTDASTFPDGGASVTPAQTPDMVFPLRTVATAQVVTVRVDRIPLGLFRVLIRNDNTGVTMNTTWSLKCKTYTLQIQ